MSKRKPNYFFSEGVATGEVYLRLVRGWDSGFALYLPTDLRAVDDDSTPQDEERGLWYSPRVRAYFSINYCPNSEEWEGFRLKAKNRREAQEYLFGTDKAH